MTAHWSAIINFIRKYVYPARMIVILLMAGATLPQIADATITDWASTVNLNYDMSNKPVIAHVWKEQNANWLYGGWVCRSDRDENEGRVTRQNYHRVCCMGLQKFVCVSGNKSAMLKPRLYWTVSLVDFVSPLKLVGVGM